MNAQVENWEDLHLILAIVRGDGLSGAARLLGIHHATVLRRLNALEQRLGVHLFERTPRGYAPTADGEELARIAARVEDDIQGAYRKVAGKDLRLSGTIRCATADYIAATFLPPILARFRERYPAIEVEVAISARFASLTKRDADIAIRPTNDPPETLVGRRLCGIGFGLYASTAHASAVSSGVELSSLDWISPDDSLSHVMTYQWRKRHFPKTVAPVRFDSLHGIFEAAKAGMGVALLPRYMADPEPTLRRLPAEAPDIELGLWLLTHPDLQRTQRVRAFLELAADEIKGLARLLEAGRPPQGSSVQTMSSD
ncbi:MAG: LysR family transcriptional regulator [Methyloligellaceae bacterium]